MGSEKYLPAVWSRTGSAASAWISTDGQETSGHGSGPSRRMVFRH